jgi:hypothetical protein
MLGGLMNDLIEGPCRSKLTFVASRDTTGCVEVDQLRRVREPVSRSKSGVQGKVADVASGRSRHAESQNELKAFQILLATGHADAWQEQPFVLEYHRDGKRHRYTPDILAVWVLSDIGKRSFLSISPGVEDATTSSAPKARSSVDHLHGVLWWKCQKESLLMDAQMRCGCAGVVIPVVTPCLRSVEAATMGNGIAAPLAGSDGGNNKRGQRADDTKRAQQAN